MTRWTEATDAADQVDDWNNTQRDEVATQRDTDWIDIFDDRRPEAWAEE